MPYNDPHIKARVICDSVNKFGNRLTTFVCTMPRIVLAEITRHRCFSFSVASSRAIPISKQIEKVRRHTFIPSWIGASQSGMSAESEVCEETQERFRMEWLLAANTACQSAEAMERLGIHKQITNRVLEPYLYVDVIISGTEWANFFKLRCSPEAQPELMALAFKMLAAYVESKPEKTDNHIPFGDQMDPGLSTQEKRLVACARCARISYDNFEGKRDTKDDLNLANRLMTSGHFSPFEHVARAHINDTYVGNFRGWVQQRKMIAGENVISIDLEKLLLTKPSWI